MYKIQYNKEIKTTTIIKKGFGPIGYYYKKRFRECKVNVTRYYGVLYAGILDEAPHKMTFYDTSAKRIRENMINHDKMEV